MINSIEDMITTKRVNTHKTPLFVGDIHGMYKDLIIMLKDLGFQWDNNQLISDKYELFSVGDQVDRGPDSLKVLDLKLNAVMGNHDWKVLRKLSGRPVTINHGSELTMEQINRLPLNKRDEYYFYLLNIPLQLIINDKYLVVHGAMINDHLDKPIKIASHSNIYGCPTKEINIDGTPVRSEWWLNYTLPYTCIYGHTIVENVFFYKNTINIDTGAVFGGKLTIFDPDNGKIYQTKTKRPSTNTSETEPFFKLER